MRSMHNTKQWAGLENIEWAGLAIALIIPQVAGGIGALATAGSVRTWYSGLRKPAWNPPGSIFGPVWGFLYLLMGIASWLIWRERRRASQVVPGTLSSEPPGGSPASALQAANRADDASGALKLYGVQLGLNTLWSLLFFGFHNPAAAMGELALLWAAITLTTIRFLRLHRPAAWLMLPYLAWTTFAGVLNATIWHLNR